LSAFGGLILMLGLFSLSVSSFKSETPPDIVEMDCQEYAASVWLRFHSYGVRGEQLEIEFEQAYWDCTGWDDETYFGF
jgi:hypothetical protein